MTRTVYIRVCVSACCFAKNFIACFMRTAVIGSSNGHREDGCRLSHAGVNGSSSGICVAGYLRDGENFGDFSIVFICQNYSARIINDVVELLFCDGDLLFFSHVYGKKCRFYRDFSSGICITINRSLLRQSRRKNFFRETVLALIFIY